MIAFLRGTLLEKGLQQVIVDVGGVGYRAHVSLQTLAELPAPGQPVELRCHTHAREDALQIFGFLRVEEQRAFELLIAVSGIGPKLALTILSGITVADLLRAIVNEDHRRLQTVPGVGKKTAERLVVELKDRCAKLEGAAVPDAVGVGNIGAEVVEALANLGYKRGQAEKAVRRVLEREGEGAQMGAEQLLRAALGAIAEK